MELDIKLKKNDNWKKRWARECEIKRKTIFILLIEGQYYAMLIVTYATPNNNNKSHYGYCYCVDVCYD